MMNLKFGTGKGMEFDDEENSNPTDPNAAESHVTEGATGTVDTQNYNSRSTMYRTDGNVLTT